MEALSSITGKSLEQSASGAAFKGIVSNLESLWFVHLVSSDNGVMAGPLNQTDGYGLNHTVPIFSRTMEFDLFDHDPRPVHSSLSRSRFEPLRGSEIRGQR